MWAKWHQDETPYQLLHLSIRFVGSGPLSKGTTICNYLFFLASFSGEQDGVFAKLPARRCLAAHPSVKTMCFSPDRHEPEARNASDLMLVNYLPRPQLG